VIRYSHFGHRIGDLNMATISFNLAVLVSFQGPTKDTFISQVSSHPEKALFLYPASLFLPCPHLPFPSIGCCHRNTVTQRQLSVGELQQSSSTPFLAVTEGQFSISAHHHHCLLGILLPSMLLLSFGSCRCVECGEHALHLPLFGGCEKDGEI
jgi:hypothetical protein